MLEVSRPAKLSDKVYETLLGMIVGGSFPERERLPSEPDLAKSLAVSRPVIREALGRLRSDGIVVSRHGSGTYVVRKPNIELLQVAPQGSIASLMRTIEFRLALECSAAELAALRRNSRDLAEIQKAFDRLEDVMQRQENGAEADLGFHLAIAAASGNELFRDTLQSRALQISEGIATARRLSIQKNPSAQRLRSVQDEHLKILKAIADSNISAAGQAMRAHLLNARDRVLTGREGHSFD